MSENNIESKAEIRNKLQAALTVLESLEANKEIPRILIKQGRVDLGKILDYLENL